LKILIIY